MLVIRHVFGTGTHCIAPSGLPLLLSLFPGLAPWAFLSRPCGASFAPETIYSYPASYSARRHGGHGGGASVAATQAICANHSMASRIIADTIGAGLVKPQDPQSKSRKLARYVPFWA